jgi:hypothetical protein
VELIKVLFMLIISLRHLRRRCLTRNLSLCRPLILTQAALLHLLSRPCPTPNFPPMRSPIFPIPSPKTLLNPLMCTTAAIPTVQIARQLTGKCALRRILRFVVDCDIPLFNCSLSLFLSLSFSLSLSLSLSLSHSLSFSFSLYLFFKK